MNGFVDYDLRALIRIPISASSGGIRTDVLVWIDTAFNGGIAIPRNESPGGIKSERSSAAAMWPTGIRSNCPAFACFFDWFGKSYQTQAVASDGKFPLLGTMLLNGHRLNVDYRNKDGEYYVSARKTKRVKTFY